MAVKGKKLTVISFEELCRLNRAPTLKADTNWVKEDGPVKASGNVLKSIAHTGAPSGTFADRADIDPDHNVLKVTTTGTFFGKYGILKLNANGTYTYTLYTKAQKPAAFEAVQGLSEGEKLKEVFKYKATDGFVTKGSTLSITIFGTDDPVTITNLTPKAEGGDAVVDEDGLPGALLDAGRTGETDSTELASATGDFKISAPDGLDDLIVGGTAVITNGVFAPVTITTPLGNELTFVSFNAMTGVVTYTYTLKAAETHPGAGEDSIFEQFVVKLTDVDGSTAIASLDIRIVDDQPTIELCEHNEYNYEEQVLDRTIVEGECAPPSPLAVDETDLYTDATSNFSGAFVGNFGADGPGTITYALDTPGGSSSLIDTLSGDPVVLTLSGGKIVGTAGPGGPEVFVISIDASTGLVTLDQKRAVVHSNPTTQLEAVGLAAGLVKVIATITDKDGDSDTATLDASNFFAFYDDAPNIDDNYSELPKLATDDSNIPDMAQADFSGAFSSAFGNDGPKDADDNDVPDDDAIDYALQINIAATSLKDVLTGEGIVLSVGAGGIIEGKTVPSGELVFKIAVDTTGLVTVTQYRAMVHPTNPDPNEPVFLPDGSISLKGTITDGDLDTDVAYRDITDAFCFNDDGPAAIGGYSADSVDEDALAPNGIEGGLGDIDLGAGTVDAVATGSVTSLFDPGNDLPPTYEINLSAANLTALEALGLKSGDVSLAYALSGDTLTATKGPGGIDVFTFKLDASTGQWTFTLKAPIDHSVADAEDDITIDFGGLIRIVDADGDWVDATGKVEVTIDDDSPTASLATSMYGQTVLDETSATSTVPAIDIGALVAGNDPDVTDAGYISSASSIGPIASPMFAFGADGPAASGSVNYSLVVGAVPSGLSITDGSPITLVAVSATVVAGVVGGAGAFAGQAAFAIEIDAATGVVKVEQYLSLDHPINPDPNDFLDLADGALLAQLQVKDFDSDTAVASLPVGGKIRFYDDGPTLDVYANPDGFVALDETATSSLLATLVVADMGDDLDVSGSGAIAIDTSNVPLVSVSALFGTDGPATIDDTTFALSVTDEDSGLFVTDGAAITLVEEGDLIVGRVASGPLQGKAAFAIAVDSTGMVTVEQYLSLKHPSNPDPDDAVAFAPDKIAIDVTITDGDGDSLTKSADISTKITFDDDGPTAVNDGKIAAVFECIDDGNIGTVATLLANDAFGADGPGSPDITIDPTGSAGGTIAIVNGNLIYSNATSLDAGQVVYDVFTYTIKDGDGDPATATFKVKVTGSDITITEAPTNVSQDEDDLANGIGDNAAGDLITPVDNGTISYTLSANATSVTSFALSAPSVTFTKLDGTSIVAAWNGTDTLVGHAVGNPADIVFTIKVNSVTNTGATYTFDLLQPVKHAGSTPGFEDDVTVSVTIDIADDCNETASADFTALIDDDIPVATSVSNPNLTDDEGKGDFAADSNPGVTPPTAGLDVAGTPGQASGGAGTLFSAGADGFQSISITGPAGIEAIYDPGTGLPAQDALTYSSSTDLAGNVTLTASGANVGVAFALTINTDGSYLFTQSAALVHPVFSPSNEDDLPLAFDFTVTDKDGDTASATLTVTVDDDTPVGGSVTQTVTEVAALTNLMLIVDVSGSMGDPSGIAGLSRLDAAKQAMIDLINAYDANGDVVVRIVTFSDSASEVGSQWMSVSQALMAIDDLAAGGFTNYDAAIETAAPGAFVDPGKIAGGQNVSYFLSDGEPNRPVGDAGIGAPEETAWETFLDTNDIISFSLGMGTGVSQTNLNPIAYNGVTNVDTNAVVVDDFADLSGVLVSTATPILVTDTAAGSFGADGGSFSLSNAGAPSGFNYVVSGNTLLIKTTGGTTVMTLTLDPLTGAYSVQQNAPIPHPGAGADTIAFNFTLNIVDGDGDGATSTITLNVTDTVPTTGANAAVQLDDDALTNGNPGGTGDVSPDTANLTGTLAHSFGSGGSIAWLTNVVTSGGATGLTYVTSGNDLLIKQNGNTVITVALDPATGVYSVTQNKALLHAAGGNENDQSFTLTYRVTDNDGDQADGTLVINVDDDTPDPITPDAEVIVNAAGQDETADLDTDGNIDDNVGADLPGKIAFANITDGQQATGVINGNTVNLTSGGKLIKLYVEDHDGNASTPEQLQGWTDFGTGTAQKIFTVTLKPDGSLATSNDVYTVDILKPIDNGAGVVFTNLSGTGPAGNVSFKIVDSDATNNNGSLEILLTPGDRSSNTDPTGGTINSDQDDIGISDQWIDPSPDVLRVDYGDFSIVSNQYQINSHTTVNGARFQLVQTGGPNTNEMMINIRAFDADDDETVAGDVGDVADVVNRVRVFASDGTTVLVERTLAEGDGTESGFTFDFQGNGSVTVTDLLEGMFVAVDTSSGFNRIEIDNVTSPAQANDQFSVGGLSVETTKTGDPISLSYQVGLTDADGDLASPLGVIGITVVPQVAIM